MKTLQAAIFAATAAMATGGCMVGPDHATPELATPDAYEAVYEPPQRSDEEWWRGYDDTQLDALVERALARNLDIAIALARLEEAEAQITQIRSGLFPRIDAAAVGQRQTVLDSGETSEASSAQLSMDFALDVFGRQRRALQQATASARSQAFIVEDVQRLTAALVVSTYIELRRTAARLDLLDTSLELQRQTLEIVQRRFEAGLAADLDVRRAEADLSRTTAQRGLLLLSRAQAEYQLSVLTGDIPRQGLSDDFGDEISIPEYAAGPPITPPAELVRSRPDLQAAEANLAAATAAIGVEIADLYPSFSLPGSISADLDASDNIAETALATIGLQIGLPLFDAGARRADVRAAEARAEAALLGYRQALLFSLQDVETALVAIESFQDRREQLQLAVTASEDAYEQLDALYREGLTSFIDILDAQRTLIGSREAQLDSEADLAAAIANLYLATGAPAIAD